MPKRDVAPPTLARSPAGGLTLTQQSAVDLLAAGKNDTETAELLNVNRCSVTRWRLYSPEFQAALSVRRADVWGSAAARLRALLPKAVDVLTPALEDGDPDDRAELALAVLKLAGPLTGPAIGSTDPEEYVRAVVLREREQTRTNLDELIDSGKGLPDFGQHLARVRQRLAVLTVDDTQNESDRCAPQAFEAHHDQPDFPHSEGGE